MHRPSGKKEAEAKKKKKKDIMKSVCGRKSLKQNKRMGRIERRPALERKGEARKRWKCV